MDHEETSRQRIKTGVSTSTKLPGTDRVTPPLVTPIVDSKGEQNEQMSLRMSELEGQSTSREKACGKRSTATEKNLAEAKNA